MVGFSHFPPFSFSIFQKCDLMAKDKKSFVLYADLLKSIEHLTNEEKGILFNHLLEYVNDKNPILTDRLILTAWKPIELQLKRDLQEWEVIKVDRSKSGVLGNLKRWNLDLYDKVVANELSLQDAEIIAKHRKTSHPDKINRNGSQDVANIAVNVTDTVTDTVNVNESENTANFRATISPDFQMMTIDDCRKKYDIENVAKREQVAMNLKVNPQQIILLQNNFDQMLKSKVDKKLFKDYTDHFANWASKLTREQAIEKIKASVVIDQPKKLTLQERYGQ